MQTFQLYQKTLNQRTVVKLSLRDSAETTGDLEIARVPSKNIYRVSDATFSDRRLNRILLRQSSKRVVLSIVLKLNDIDRSTRSLKRKSPCNRTDSFRIASRYRQQRVRNGAELTASFELSNIPVARGHSFEHYQDLISISMLPLPLMACTAVAKSMKEPVAAFFPQTLVAPFIHRAEVRSGARRVSPGGLR